MNHLFLILLLVVGTTIAAALFFGRDQSGDRPRFTHPSPTRTEPPKPRLHGRGPMDAVERALRRSAAEEPIDADDVPTGRVLGPDSLPVVKALVYLLPKISRGVADVHGLSHTYTRDDGTFDFPEDTRFDGRWVVALVEHLRHGWADGDEPRPPNGILITLRSGEPVRVLLRGTSVGEPVGTRLSVAGAAGQSKLGFEYPGPEAEALPRILRFLPPGEDQLVTTIGSRSPIHIQPAREGCYFVPASLTVSWPYGEAVFTVYSSCGVHIVVLHAETGMPVDTGATAVLKNKAGRVVCGTHRFSPDGLLPLSDDLRPGRYTLAVSAEGYKTQEHVIDLVEPGQIASVTARMVPDADEFGIHVKLVGYEGLWRPMVLCRRRTEVPAAWREPSKVTRLPTSADYAEFRVLVQPPGYYDFLISSAAGAKACYAEGVHIRSAPHDMVTVTLEPGAMLKAASVWQANWEEIRNFSIATDRLGTLPVFRATSTTRSLYGIAHTIPSADSEYGPYPRAEVRLRGTACLADGHEEHLDRRIQLGP